MDLTPAPEARIIPVGDPVEGGITLFSGSVEEARAIIERMSEEERADVSVWTAGNMRSVADFMADPSS